MVVNRAIALLAGVIGIRFRTFAAIDVAGQIPSHQTDAVFLMGLPDVAESRPHSKSNWDREVGITG